MTPAHLILTRFNCRFAAAWTRVALDPAWLAARFRLFDEYCLPSIVAQTRKSFRWIILFDEKTPSSYRTRAESIASEIIRPLFVGTLTSDMVREVIRDNLPAGATHVITTRLDNDDAIASDFVERLQGAFVEGQKQYLNFPDGFILRGTRLYRRFDPHNAFVSLAEPVNGAIDGVWTVPHTEIDSHAPVQQVGGGPAWVQVVHDVNVSNKVRGLRVPLAELGMKFALDPSLLHAKDGGWDTWRDRHLMYPIWLARDSAAGAYRKIGRWLRRRVGARGARV